MRAAKRDVMVAQRLRDLAQALEDGDVYGADVQVRATTTVIELQFSCNVTLPPEPAAGDGE